MTLGAGSGNVGIGTSTPTAKLEVRGNIQLGANGQFFAAASTENLRMVRGTIADNGNKIVGDGFTSQRTQEGRYLITFNTPFADLPSITATADVVPGLGGHVAMPENVTKNDSEVWIFRVNGDIWKDRAFHFTAVGPR